MREADSDSGSNADLQLNQMISRREIAGVIAASAWTARSYSQIVGANERLGIGVIGCGGMANAHMNRLLKLREKSDNFEFVAVCDLYDKRRDAAAQLTGWQALHPLS